MARSADHDTRAGSFGAVAEDYDRYRPAPAPAALDWLVPQGTRTILDVAAGTGLLTRALAGRAARVSALEPDDRMRAVLARRSPEVEALAGRGEAIPLPDASVDVVLVSCAWHWLDPTRALPEIARVLVDGGRLGVLGTHRDPDVAWVADLEAVADAAARDEPPPTPRHGGTWARQDADLDPTLFTGAGTASFSSTRLLSRGELVGMLMTYSGFLVSTRERQQAVHAAATDFLARRFPGGELELPLVTRCWRADRAPRGA